MSKQDVTSKLTIIEDPLSNVLPSLSSICLIVGHRVFLIIFRLNCKCEQFFWLFLKKNLYSVPSNGGYSQPFDSAFFCRFVAVLYRLYG